MLIFDPIDAMQEPVYIFSGQASPTGGDDEQQDAVEQLHQVVEEVAGWRPLKQQKQRIGFI